MQERRWSYTNSTKFGKLLPAPLLIQTQTRYGAQATRSQHSVLQWKANPASCFWSIPAALRGPTDCPQQLHTYWEAPVGNGSWPSLALPHTLRYKQVLCHLPIRRWHCFSCDWKSSMKPHLWSAFPNFQHNWCQDRSSYTTTQTVTPRPSSSARLHDTLTYLALLSTVLALNHVSQM